MRTLLLILGALLLNSCALLSSDRTEEEMYADDPVAQAALALRPDRAPAGEISSLTAQGQEPISSQLTLGMSTSRVRDLWGQPQEVENAGDATSGNQRWTYLTGLKRGWGTSDYRVVYFERNRVVGWENHR